MVAPMIALARALFGSIRPWDLCAISVAAAVAILGACASVSGGDGTRVSADLLQRARRTGEIKVIVQLRVDSGASEQAIEATKVALLAEIANTDYKVVREFRGLPLMALEASYATLTILDSSPRVLRVEEDSLARPQG
jgi:hypothetical protein